jgi:hypothetical protein
MYCTSRISKYYYLFSIFFLKLNQYKILTVDLLYTYVCGEKENYENNS